MKFPKYKTIFQLLQALFTSYIRKTFLLKISTNKAQNKHGIVKFKRIVIYRMNILSNDDIAIFLTETLQ